MAADPQVPDHVPGSRPNRRRPGCWWLRPWPSPDRSPAWPSIFPQTSPGPAAARRPVSESALARDSTNSLAPGAVRGTDGLPASVVGSRAVDGVVASSSKLPRPSVRLTPNRCLGASALSCSSPHPLPHPASQPQQARARRLPKPSLATPRRTGSGKARQASFSALLITCPVSVTRTSRGRRNGQRVMYCTNRSMPARSPAGTPTGPR